MHSNSCNCYLDTQKCTRDDKLHILEYYCTEVTVTFEAVLFFVKDLLYSEFKWVCELIRILNNLDMGF